ncbi:MAG: 30S ribosome-binding factor RbfA [Verrucomicrobiales bacterium]
MSQRINRVNELLKREISGCIEKNFEFPDVLVTVHEVSTAIDLKTAQVFVGVIGSESETRSVVDRLNAKRGFIQNTVMKRVVLRNTPQLTFKTDTAIERGVRVLDILDDIGEIDLPDEPTDDGST